MAGVEQVQLREFVATSLPRRVLLWMLTRNPQRTFFHKCLVWMTTAKILEIYGQQRNAKVQNDSSRWKNRR
jgi:hypothetical protein